MHAHLEGGFASATLATAGSNCTARTDATPQMSTNDTRAASCPAAPNPAAPAPTAGSAVAWRANDSGGHSPH